MIRPQHYTCRATDPGVNNFIAFLTGFLWGAFAPRTIFRYIDQMGVREIAGFRLFRQRRESRPLRARI